MPKNRGVGGSKAYVHIDEKKSKNLSESDKTNKKSDLFFLKGEEIGADRRAKRAHLTQKREPAGSALPTGITRGKKRTEKTQDRLVKSSKTAKATSVPRSS